MITLINLKSFTLGAPIEEKQATSSSSTKFGVVEFDMENYPETYKIESLVFSENIYKGNFKGVSGFVVKSQTEIHKYEEQQRVKRIQTEFKNSKYRIKMYYRWTFENAISFIVEGLSNINFKSKIDEIPVEGTNDVQITSYLNFIDEDKYDSMINSPIDIEERSGFLVEKNPYYVSNGEKQFIIDNLTFEDAGILKPETSFTVTVTNNNDPIYIYIEIEDNNGINYGTLFFGEISGVETKEIALPQGSFNYVVYYMTEEKRRVSIIVS